MTRKSLSKQKIADAALAEFAEHGFAGSRTDRIAKRAGLNKQLLYYYYGSKAALFEAVAKEVAGGLRPTGVADSSLSQRSTRAVTAYLRALHQRLDAHRDAARLVIGSLVQPTTAPAAIELMRELVADLARLISDGQGHGHFRDDVDPVAAARQAVVLVIGYRSLGPAISLSQSEGDQWIEGVEQLLVDSLEW